MTEKEHIPTSTEFLDKILKNESWNPIYRRPLEELFRSPAFCATLRELIKQSDETLKNVGLTDLTKEDSIRNALRTQGIAAGLSLAVETICGLASEPENPPTEEKRND